MSAKSARHARAFRSIFSKKNLNRGKITLASTLLGAIVLPLVGVVFFELQTSIARADNVPTSVTVLNTPPTWVNEAQELNASATTTPTNAGTVLSWIATADDSSGDDYYLIICKTSVAPTPGVSGGAPSCNGGVANQWAVSASTDDNTQATAATTTKDTFPFNNESNDWWAWVCDANVVSSRCLGDPSQGEAFGDAGSPFVINHVPIFAALSNNGPIDPGNPVTWSTTSYDNDTLGGSQDTVRIFVCRTGGPGGFATSTGCTGGTWATSTPATSNASTTAPIIDPYPDGSYDAFVYLMDNHGLVATSTFHMSNSAFTVNNITPTIDAAFINLEDVEGTLGDDLNLTVPNGLTTGFTVDFIVTDANSCVKQGGSGNEISSAIANIYRSSVGQSSCQAATGHYSASACYPNADPLFSPHISCVQSAAVNACNGVGDPDVGWRCTFSLWYVADPTVDDSQHPTDNWRASVRVSDDDFATSTLEESTVGSKEMEMFLAFDVPESSIAYESLEPGQNSPTLGPSPTTTSLLALGNVGLDEDLYGDTMCPTSFWTAPDSCDTDGPQPARDIPVDNQKFATSSVAYGSAQAFALTGSSTPTTLLVNVPKTTSTSSPQSRLTHWGIAIPNTITTAGAYEGQNTITAKFSNASFW